MAKELQEYEEKIMQLETALQKTTDILNNYKKEQEEFILIASHDLQAPLRKISTFIERLTSKTKDMPEEVKTYTERIQLAVTNMRSLINGLSTLSNVTEDQQGFEKCDLNELLNHIIKDAQIYGDINIQYTSMPVIEGNCTHLKHLFQNLVENAIKFQKKEGPLQITISSMEISEEEKRTFDFPANKIYYKIEIADNGIGFEDRYSEKIFKPFHRLHGKSEYEGNGMGLAICKKITEKHKGIIYAKGGDGNGARFILILPEISD